MEKKQVIVDVRERDEFEAEHVPCSIHVPLSAFATVAPGVLEHLKDREILFMCRSGNRARLASEQVRGLGFGDLSARVFEGGILEWKRQGKEIVVRRQAPLPIMRQVQLGAGLLVLVGVALSQLVAPAWIWLSGFVGAGLTVAGSTGICGMAILLSKAPWNRSPEEACNP